MKKLLQKTAAVLLALAMLLPLCAGTVSADEKGAGGVDGFVTRLYETCLDRAPDEGGFRDWTGQLNSGEISGTYAAYGFIFSEEFKNRNYCDEHYIMQLYRAFMGREYDEGGLAYWLGQMDNGENRESIFNGFAGSDEFKNLCAEYGIRQGGGIDASGFGTTSMGACSVCGKKDGYTEFLTNLYEVCLFRQPDSDGLADWKSSLASREKTGMSTARGVIFSEEFTRNSLSNYEFVQTLYRALMGREPDEAGLNDWTGKLNEGWSRETVFYGFALSDEFSILCEQYGIVAGIKTDDGEQATMYLNAMTRSSDTEYLVMVNRSTHRLGLYRGYKGAWREVFYTPCGDGKASTPTVEGTFRLYRKTYAFLSNDGIVKCFYASGFFEDYYVHSVLYKKEDTYPQHIVETGLGYAVSHGCVRIDTGLAEFIYDNVPIGSTVVVYHD